jgi:hypothetical protein
MASAKRYSNLFSPKNIIKVLSLTLCVFLILIFSLFSNNTKNINQNSFSEIEKNYKDFDEKMLDTELSKVRTKLKIYLEKGEDASSAKLIEDLNRKKIVLTKLLMFKKYGDAYL